MATSTFRKAVLQVGQYASPDGVVDVTPQRLKHWQQQVSRVQRQGYAIPMHWDHATTEEMDLLEPIKLTALQENKVKSAQKTVGLLKDFKVNPDGNSATLVVEARTKGAREKMESNTVYVSPVLFDRWKDGSGQEYVDTIGSVDLVDYPVDYSQGPFEPVAPVATAMSCVIRMSSAPSKIYRLATMGDDPKKNPFDSNSDNGSESQSDDSNSDSESGSGFDEMIDTSPGQEAMNENSTPTDPTSVSDVIQSLAQLQIMLPDDTNTENFLERLRPALMTAIAAKVAPTPPPLATSLPPEQSPPGSQTQEQPQLADQPYVAAMSAKLKALENKQIEDQRSKLQKDLHDLLVTGRLSPKEHHSIAEKLKVKKMSLVGDAMTVDAGEIGVWIESRKALPKGAVWSRDERLTKLSLTTHEPPEGRSANNGMTKADEDKAVKALTT